MDNYSLSDIKSALGGNDEGFGGGAWWIIILFLFVFMGGGGGLFGRSSSDNPATQGQMTDQFNFEALRAGQNDVASSLKDVAYGNLSAIKEVEATVNGILPAVENCCCNILRANDQTRYDMANMSAAIQANSTANTQRILDKLCADQTAALQNQVNQLQLQSQLAGVVRYPMATAYCSGGNPFGCGCGGTGTSF